MTRKVFISYSHGTSAHDDGVLALADRLRVAGIDCQLDQYEESPAEGWPRWMDRQIRQADVVLCICDEAYYRKVSGLDSSASGLGAKWEGLLIYQHLYDASGANAKFVPVLFESGEVRHIPDPIRGATHYRVSTEDGYLKLYRRLSGQQAVLKPELGPSIPLPPRERSTLRIWNVPFTRNPSFTGRDAVFRILAESRGGASTVGIRDALSGMGGIGKTQTAVEYAYRDRHAYTAVLWFQADSLDDLHRSFNEVARLLGLREANAENQREIIAAVTAWLQKNDGWLCIFDNVETPGSIAHLLSPNPKGHTLVTSRTHSFDVLGIQHPISLSVFQQAEAVDFLQGRVRRHDASASEIAALRELADELGYLPLALEQAAAYIVAREVPVRAYLTSYQKSRLQLLERDRPIAGTSRLTVGTTWALNFVQVNALSVAAGDLLRVAAFLAPDSIPLQLLRISRQHLGPVLSDALHSIDEDPVVLYDLLHHLLTFSLIKLDHRSEAFSVHRLVQEAVKGNLGPSEQKEWAQRVVAALNNAFPEASFPNWPLCEQLAPHLRVAAALVAEYGIGLEHASHLLNEGASYLRMRGNYVDAEEIHKQSLALRESSLSSNNQAIAESLNDLAFVYVDQFDYAKAEPLFVRALAIAESAGPQDRELALYLMNLGNLYVKMGDCEKAEPFIQRAMSVWDAPSGQEYFQASLLNSQAEVLLGLGKFEEARVAAESALTIRKRIGNLMRTAASYTTLAYAYLKLERLAVSDMLFGQALTALEEVYGPRHRELILALERYSELLRATGRSDAARDTGARARAIRNNLAL